MSRYPGFPVFGSDDEDIIISASLTSASDLDGATANNPEFITYADAGVLVGVTSGDGAYVRWPTATIADLGNGGAISFEIEKGFFAGGYSLADTQILTWANGTGIWYVRKNGTDSAISVVNSGLLANEAEVSNEGNSTHSRVDISWNHSEMSIYIDYMLVLKNTLNVRWQPDGRLYVSGSGSGGSTGNVQVYRIKNYQVQKRPITLPVLHQIGTVVVTGDSFSKLGNYPLNDLAILGYQADDYGDGSTAAVDYNYERGILPTIHRTLAKQGYHVGDNKVKWYGRGGARVDSAASRPLSERTDVMLADVSAADYPTPGVRDTTDVLVCLIGTNDVGGGVSDADFETSYKAEVDRWDAAGIDHIILVDIAQRYAAGPGAAIDTAGILAKNAIIYALEEYNSKVKVARVYAATAADSSLITTDGIHPSITGHQYIGKQVAFVVIDAITRS